MAHCGNEFNCKVVPTKKCIPNITVRIKLPYICSVDCGILIPLSEMLGDSVCKGHTVKKMLEVFLCRVGMSLTKLSLARNNFKYSANLFLQCSVVPSCVIYICRRGAVTNSKPILGRWATGDTCWGGGGGLIVHCILSVQVLLLGMLVGPNPSACILPLRLLSTFILFGGTCHSFWFIFSQADIDTSTFYIQ